MKNENLIEHYSTELGGNIYKLHASPISAIRALLFGWERATDHPAQFHYGFDYTLMRGWNASIRKSVEESQTRLGLLSNESRNILEAGCGLGGSSMQMASTCPRWNMFGVSLVADQMRVAQRMARQRNIKNVEFVPADFLHLPFRDGFFDGIFITEAFGYVPPNMKVSAFSELKRVSSPSGRMVIMDGYEAVELTTEQLQDLTIIKAGWTLPEQSTTRAFRNCAEAAGLRVVSEELATHRIWTASQALARKAKRWHPIILTGKGLRSITFVERILQRAGFSSINAIPFAETMMAQWRLLQSGGWNYYVHILEKA